MPIHDFKCSSCGFTDEYIVTPSIQGAIAPSKCPKCSEGIMERQFSVGQTMAFDIIGPCYTNDHGPKAWKKRLSLVDQAKVLSPDENGVYKNPY